MYLLDTMIVSELRKPRRHPGLVAWLEQARPIDCYLSVVTVGEIEKGISRQERRDPRFARRLATWLDTLLVSYAARILPVSVGIARRWGRLADAHGHAGADLLIAATALQHGLMVVTRNVRHFDGTGVPVTNPFA